MINNMKMKLAIYLACGMCFAPLVTDGLWHFLLFTAGTFFLLASLEGVLTSTFLAILATMYASFQKAGDFSVFEIKRPDNDTKGDA